MRSVHFPRALFLEENNAMPDKTKGSWEQLSAEEQMEWLKVRQEIDELERTTHPHFPLSGDTIDALTDVAFHSRSKDKRWEEIKIWVSCFFFAAVLVPFFPLLLPNSVFFVVAENFLGEDRLMKIMNYTLFCPLMLWTFLCAIFCVHGLVKSLKGLEVRK